MGPSWWAASQVEVQQLCRRGIQREVPPASQPWASGSLVTYQAAGGSKPMGVHRSAVGPHGARNPFSPSFSGQARSSTPQSPGRRARNKGEQVPERRNINHTCPAPIPHPGVCASKWGLPEPGGWDESLKRKGLWECLRAQPHLLAPHPIGEPCSLGSEG